MLHCGTCSNTSPIPGPLFAKIHRVLRPGGILFLGVPNFGSMEAKLTRQGYDLFSATASLLNQAGLAHNFLYNMLRKIGTKTQKSERNVVVQIAGHTFLLPPVAFPGGALALLAPVFSSGATQSVWARKD